MHQHQWNEAKFANGAKNKRAPKMSDGATCSCGLVAKAPTRATTDASFKTWIDGLK